MTSIWKSVLMTALCTAAYSQDSLAQVAPPTILDIGFENQVQYVEDVSDVSKFASDPSAIPACGTSLAGSRPDCLGQPLTFHAFLVLTDIVSINGQAVKGTGVIYGRRIQAFPTPGPRQVIADIQRVSIQEMTFEILTVDGRAIGSLMFSGLGAGPTAPPGAPLLATSGNYAIVGGTGAFLGVRGQMSGVVPFEIPVRAASIAEDPASRRTNGGGRVRVVAQLIPMTRPEIVTPASGPAVFHGDLSPVTAAKPAKAGEDLITMATGLGPTRPGVDPGQPFPPFPANPLQPVNSPVEVKVNGQSATVINALGWPGLVDTYRVDFRVPDGTASGMAGIQLIAAWILGPSVNVPVQ